MGLWYTRRYEAEPLGPSGTLEGVGNAYERMRRQPCACRERGRREDVEICPFWVREGPSSWTGWRSQGGVCGGGKTRHWQPYEARPHPQSIMEQPKAVNANGSAGRIMAICNAGQPVTLARVQGSKGDRFLPLPRRRHRRFSQSQYRSTHPVSQVLNSPGPPSPKVAPRESEARERRDERGPTELERPPSPVASRALASQNVGHHLGGPGHMSPSLIMNQRRARSHSQ